MVFIESPLTDLKATRCYLFVSLLFELTGNGPFAASCYEVLLRELN